VSACVRVCKLHTHIYDYNNNSFPSAYISQS